MSASKGVEATVPKESVMTPYVRECLDKVAVAEGFVNYEIDFNASAAVGDGFIGIMFKAVIRENESDKTLGVIVKSPPTNKDRRVQFGAMEMFEREVYVYKNILPNFTKFQEEKKIAPEKRFTQFPKCYFAEFDSEKDESVIIMEDLKERDFVMCNKAVPASFEHAKLVFTALGRFHAISYALKTQKPELFSTYKKLKDFLAQKLYRDEFKQTMISLVDRAAETFDENEVDMKRRVLKLKEDVKGMLIELCDSDGPEPFTILGHGDCWSNNFMYKFQNGSPSDIVLLDWQILRYVSPALDLAHFTFVCTDSRMRAKHYDELLKIYHNALLELLSSLGGDAEKQFPFSALLDQMKKFGKFGVIMSLIMIPILQTSSEDFPDLDDMAEGMADKPSSFTDAFGKNDKSYKERMNGVLSDAIRYGYL